MKVSSHISKYRGFTITVAKHKDHDGTLHLNTTIDGKVFHSIATDSFTSIVKECHVLIDHWIAERLTNDAASRGKTGRGTRSSRLARRI